MARKHFWLLAALCTAGILIWFITVHRARRGPAPVVSLRLSNPGYDFGPVVVAQSATHDVVAITNTGNVTGHLALAIEGDPAVKLRPDLSCEAELAPGGVCAVAVSITPTKPGKIAAVLTVSLSLREGLFHRTKALVRRSVALSGTGAALDKGQSLLTGTANPVVALYTYYPPEAGKVWIEFGPDAKYGLRTSAVATGAEPHPVGILVAGMMQDATYHMRAVLQTPDGRLIQDPDHTFHTRSFPAAMLPKISARTAPGATPQPGIELANASLSLENLHYLETYAVDLKGNLIWGYNFADRPTRNTIVQPIRLLPNGNLVLVLSYASQFALPNPFVDLTGADKSVDLIREINLAGDPVEQLTIDQLNRRLAEAGHRSLRLVTLHHELTVLPNGHMIVIGSTFRNIRLRRWHLKRTQVLGDVLIDLDPSFHPVWVWNEFDHLYIYRHPIGFPDWTHTNAVLYSRDDGDLLVSMRHQGWVVKIDYQNGKGSGRILWRLGNEGNFRLIGGTAPQDWFYGQHQPSFVTKNTSGQFSLALMDNGYGRVNADGTICGISPNAQCYTTVPILKIDEARRTATIVLRKVFSPADYSFWGGSTTMLPNGDLEYDLCTISQGTGSEVDEVTINTPTPKLVWTMKETGANLYRAHRIPSLYPGVTW